MTSLCSTCEGPLEEATAVVFTHEPVAIQPLGSDAFAPMRMVNEAGADEGLVVVCPGCADALAHGRAGELVTRMEAQLGSPLAAPVRSEAVTFYLALCNALTEGWIPGVEGWERIADEADGTGG